MLPSPVRLAICAIAVCLVELPHHVSMGEEGMYPLSMLPQIDLAARGISLTADEIFQPGQVSLVDGICRVNGCTGSFVSPDGLIITNHHCAYQAIQQASTAAQDLLLHGFQSSGRADEIPAPDYVVRITQDYRDVSADVLTAVDDRQSPADRTRAIDRRCRELEVAAELQHSGLRAEVAEMFAGRTYVLFLYTYLKDVRLVFAPPSAVGNFGGEADNWEWPRHTGDFAFLRAYTAPDGSSAAYSADNIPFRPKRFIQVEPQGVDEGDAVFLLGYPGRTVRHKTASFLRYESDVRLPLLIELYQWQISEMQKVAASDRAVAIKHASRQRSLANVEKRSRGQVLGLQRAQIVQRRSEQEQLLQDYIAQDQSRSARFGPVLPQITAVYDEMSNTAPLEIHLDQLRSACRAAAVGHFLYDAAVERTKANLDRETPYMDRNFGQSVEQLKAIVRDWHAETDIVMLSGMLQRLQHFPAAAEIPVLAELMKSNSSVQAQAERLIQKTSLGSPDFVQECLNSTPERLQQLDDPVLQLMIQLHPVYLEIREREKQRDGKLGPLYASLLQVKQEYLDARFIPDANATLRLTSGRIRGYSPADAVIRTPISTGKGVLEKTTGVEPYVTPSVVLDQLIAGNFGRYAHSRLSQVPVNLLYDADTTGGNSGSPIFNHSGNLVGVNFDRCFEATINDFAWDASYSRSIGVDIRYVLWLTGPVYGADHLLTEMGVGP